MTVTLQEMSMKHCVSNAGMLSAAAFACGTSFVILSGNGKEGLVRLLQTLGTYTVHALVL